MTTPALTGTRTQTSALALAGTTLAAPSRAVLVGDIIIVPAQQGVTTKQTLTVSDGVNTYHQIGTDIDVGAPDDTSVTFWYAIATTAATIAPQLNFGATNTGPAAIWFDLARNVDNSIVLSDNKGQLQTAVGTGANAVTSTAGTPKGARTGWLVYGFSLNTSASAVPGSGTGFTDGGTGWDFGFGTALARSESKLVSVGTAVAATFTATEAGDDYITLLGIFNGAPSGSGLFFGAGTTS